MTEQDLKKQLLVIAGFISAGEEITSEDASIPLQPFVEVLVAQCHDNPVRLALLSTGLARYISETAS